MTTVNTLSTSTNTYTYDEFAQMVNAGQVKSSDVDDVTVFSASSDSSECTDGEDDGKIGLGSALLNIGKGVISGAVNMVKGAFTDEEGNFSLGQTLKTVGLTALCFVPVVGQFVAAGLCAYGCVTGAVGLANGIYSGLTAETDAEAKAAWQSVGTSGLTLGLSAYGMKKVGGSIGKTYGEGVSAENSLVENIGTVKNNIVGDFKSYYGSSWSQGVEASYTKAGVEADSASSLQKLKANANGLKSAAQEGAKGTVHNIAETSRAIKDKVSEKYNKATAKADGYFDELAKNEGAKIEAEGNTKTVTTEKGDKTTTKTYTKNSAEKWELTNKSSTTTKTNPETGAETKIVKNSNGSSIKTTTDNLGNTTEIKTAADGSTTTTARDSIGYEKSSSSTSITEGSKITTTDFNSSELAKEYNLTKAQVKTLSEGGTVTTKNGTTLTTTAADDMGSVSIKTKTNLLDAASKGYTPNSSKFKSTSYGTVLDAAGSAEEALALAALPGRAANETTDSMENIKNATTTYVTTTNTTGVKYDLQDYTIPTSEDLDKTYAEIYSSAFQI